MRQNSKLSQSAVWPSYFVFLTWWDFFVPIQHGYAWSLPLIGLPAVCTLCHPLWQHPSRSLYIKHIAGVEQQIWNASHRDNTAADRKGVTISLGKNGLFYVGACVTVLPSSSWRKGSTRLNWLSNCHRRPFTQTALSYFSCNMNWWRKGSWEGEKMQLLPLPPFVWHLCHVWSQKDRTALVIMPPPHSFLTCTTDTGVQDPISWTTEDCQKWSAIYAITLYSSSILMKPPPYMASPKAIVLQLHHILWWTGPKAFSQ